jgi:hypothetical protein
MRRFISSKDHLSSSESFDISSVLKAFSVKVTLGLSDKKSTFTNPFYHKNII